MMNRKVNYNPRVVGAAVLALAAVIATAPAASAQEARSLTIEKTTITLEADATSVVGTMTRSPNSVQGMNVVRVKNGVIRDSEITGNARATSVVWVMDRSPGSTSAMNYVGQ